MGTLAVGPFFKNTYDHRRIIVVEHHLGTGEGRMQEWEYPEDELGWWCPCGSVQPQQTRAARLRGEVEVEGPVGLVTE